VLQLEDSRPLLGVIAASRLRVTRETQTTYQTQSTYNNNVNRVSGTGDLDKGRTHAHIVHPCCAQKLYAKTSHSRPQA
jgi:hypothetical protein